MREYSSPCRVSDDPSCKRPMVNEPCGIPASRRSDPISAGKPLTISLHKTSCNQHPGVGVITISIGGGNAWRYGKMRNCEGLINVGHLVIPFLGIVIGTGNPIRNLSAVRRLALSSGNNTMAFPRPEAKWEQSAYRLLSNEGLDRVRKVPGHGLITRCTHNKTFKLSSIFTDLGNR